jgi:hypothetical protein
MQPLALLVVLAASLIAGAAKPDRSPFRHVRATDERVERVLDAGTNRSPTFARLRAALERSDVIVYIQPSPNLPHGVDGRLGFLNAAGSNRYLRIELRNTLGLNQMVVILGHELQHAVEIAGADGVRDESSMIGLYRRIGLSSVAQSHFETNAARAAGWQVRAELW